MLKEKLEKIDLNSYEAPDLIENLPHGDMPGDKIVVNEDHVKKAKLIFPRLIELMREEKGDKIVVSVFGGILGVGKHDFADDEAKFKAIGFDHVYPPESPIEKSILDLCKDLEAKGRLVK